MRHFKLILIAALLGTVLTSEYSRAQMQDRWDYYTHIGQVNAVADGGAYIWASTWGGLVRFEKSTHSYTLYPRRYGSLATSPNGTVWYYGDSTISYYNGSQWKNQSFRNDTNTIKFSPPLTSLPMNVYALTFDRTGNPFAVIGDGYHPEQLARFDGQTWSVSALPSMNPAFSPHGMLVDKSGDLWLCGNEKAHGSNYSRYDNSVVAHLHGISSTVWKQEDGLPAHTYITRDFLEMSLDSAGHIWTSRWDGSSMFDGTKWTSYPHVNGNLNNGPLKSSGQLLTVDPHNHICFAGEGVSEFDGTNWAYSSYPDLSSGEENALAISTSGELWTTNDSGAYRLANGKWIHYTTADGLPSNLCSAAVPDRNGDILIATNEGVARFANGQWTTYLVPQTIPGNEIGRYSNGPFCNALACDPANNLWVASTEENAVIMPGVTRYDGTTWKTFTTKDGLINDTTNDLACDPKGKLWVSDQRAISTFSGSTWKNITLQDTATNTRVYGMIASDSSGTIYAATCARWLLPGPPSNWYWTLPEILQYTPTPEGPNGTWRHFGPNEINYLSWNGVECIAANKYGHVWAAGYQVPDSSGNNTARGGLYHFDGTRWGMIDLDSGSANATFIDPKAIACATDGSVWISYNTPISSNDKKLLGPIVHYDGKTWQHFGGYRDTLPGLFCGAISVEPNGHVLASTNFGVVEYDGNNWSVKYAIGKGLPQDNVSAIAPATDGSIWFGTTDSGIAHFLPGSSGVSTGHSATGGMECSVYPNPLVTDVAHVSISGTQIGSYRITLCNLLGEGLRTERLMMQTSNTTVEYDLQTSGVAAGSYFITIDNGVESVTVPVIKE